MEWDFLKTLLPLVVFFGSAFLWLLRRMDRKQAEDKTTFVDIYQKYNKLNEQVAFIRGKTRSYDDLPDTKLP